MRVILNALASLKPRTGIGHYIHSLYEHLLPIAGEGRLLLFPDPLTRRVLGSLLNRGGGRRRPAGPGSRAGFALKQLLTGPARLLKHLGHRAVRRAFAAFAARHGCALYHEPNYVPWPCDAPAVSTIHDLSVLLHPEWHPAERVKYYERHFFRNLHRCRRLIADSEAIRNEVVKHLGIPADRVTAIHLGVRPIFRPLPAEEIRPVLDRMGLAPGYLLHVGTIEPRKNLLMLMGAYCDLPRELRERHPLVLIGGWGWRNEDVRTFYEETGRHAGVRQIGYAAEEDLAALYGGARALVFPSHYEGFGFPPLEMLACGGAVIASTAASVAEILPPGTRRLAPGDVSGWRDAMREMLVDDDLWRRARDGSAAHAGRFSWKRCARQTWQVYEETLAA